MPRQTWQLQRGTILKNEHKSEGLSRRERQIMDVVYMLGETTAAGIHAEMQDEISDASLRKLVRILEQKGHLNPRKQGREHIYFPTVSEGKARLNATRHLLKTMFQGSVSAAVSALLDASEPGLDEDEAQRIRGLINQAEKEGR